MTGRFIADTTPFIIGGNGNGVPGAPTELFPGRVDEIMLYRRALGADEIAQLHEGALFAAPPAPTPAGATDTGYLGDMSAIETYTGGCHCGKVRYEVKLDLTKPVISCNCSMCGRSGTLLTFVPADQFTLKSGEEDLTDYQFNKHVIHHVFCRVCGIKSFARGRAETAARPSR